MTPLQWLVYEYPKMKMIHRPFLFIVHPGEVVWIPDDWPHVRIILASVYTQVVHVSSFNINLVHSLTQLLFFYIFMYYIIQYMHVISPCSLLFLLLLAGDSQY